MSNINLVQHEEERTNRFLIAFPYDKVIPIGKEKNATIENFNKILQEQCIGHVWAEEENGYPLVVIENDEGLEDFLDVYGGEEFRNNQELWPIWDRLVNTYFEE